MIDDDKLLIQEIIKRRGASFVQRSLSQPVEAEDLTIISNGGLHPLPSDYIFGDLYVASEGSLDFSSTESVNREIDSVLGRLQAKLLSRKWGRVYLVPFGHAIISMNIKMAVYRTLRIETTDLFYFGNGEYGVLERDTRKVLIAARRDLLSR